MPGRSIFALLLRYVGYKYNTCISFYAKNVSQCVQCVSVIIHLFLKTDFTSATANIHFLKIIKRWGMVRNSVVNLSMTKLHVVVFSMVKRILIAFWRNYANSWFCLMWAVTNRFQHRVFPCRCWKHTRTQGSVGASHVLLLCRKDVSALDLQAEAELQTVEEGRCKNH